MGESENVYLKQISADLVFIKKKVLEMEENIQTISNDLHDVRSEYVEKLKKMENEPSKKYKNLDEFEKELKRD